MAQSDKGGTLEPRDGTASRPRTAAAKPERRSLSMHDGVEVWEDCCSCEAEPYWVNAFEKSTEDEAET